MKFFIISVLSSALLAGCGLPQKGLWKHKSGGEALTIDQPNDSAILSTEFGRIKIQPFFVNSAYGFVVKVWIENTSSKPVSYKFSDFKVQNQAGEIFDALDEDGVKSSVEGNVGMLNAGMGASYGTQAGVASTVWKDLKNDLITKGEVPSNATKTGRVYFPKNSSLGVLKIRIANLEKQELVVSFEGAKN